MQEQKPNAETALIAEIGLSAIAVKQNILKYPFSAEQPSQIFDWWKSTHLLLASRCQLSHPMKSFDLMKLRPVLFLDWVKSGIRKGNT
jgi:hypothetical protein